MMGNFMKVRKKKGLSVMHSKRMRPGVGVPEYTSFQAMVRTNEHSQFLSTSFLSLLAPPPSFEREHKLLCFDFSMSPVQRTHMFTCYSRH
jgi:hypothetical protein